MCQKHVCKGDATPVLGHVYIVCQAVSVLTSQKPAFYVGTSCKVGALTASDVCTQSCRHSYDHSKVSILLMYLQKLQL